MRPHLARLLVFTLLGLHAGCGVDEGRITETRVSDIQQAEVSDSTTLPDIQQTEVSDSTTLSDGGEICNVDFPCFAGGPSCSLTDPSAIRMFESYSCEEVCGSAPCSGGGCLNFANPCPSEHVCATDGVEKALCVPKAEACGGPDGIRCPSGQVCHHGRFHTDYGIYPSESCATWDSGVFGHCVPMPDCDDTAEAPVCGCDGVLYLNDCARQKAGAPDLGPPERCSGPPLTAGQCLTDAQCTMEEHCEFTNADNVCGACQELPECASAADCASTPETPLCDQRPLCLCSGSTTCLAACSSDAECSRDEVCLPSGYCEYRACDPGCPSTFMCDVESSLCLRRTCTSGDECIEGDACVRGQCESKPGVCSLPVP